MSTSIVPVEWRLQAARRFIGSFTEVDNTAWYVWFGDHVSTDAPGDVYDMVIDTSINAYRNMVFGKRISTTDVTLMIRRIPWTSGVVYTAYDPGDPIMQTKDYFVIVDEGSFWHVFKCLDNNNGTPSTVAPSFGEVNDEDQMYQTGDGYRWHYMYSVDQLTVDHYATDSSFPLRSNAAVTASAVSGAIDVTRVYDGGQGYDNYLTGTFDASHVRVGGNNLVYAVSSNTSASPVVGFYTGCAMYISAGQGVGQYRTAVDYFTNATGNFVTLDSPFLTPPTNASEFELFPTVSIQAGGDQTVNASARALVNAVGNSIYRVEMLDRGAGYSYATATVVANAVVSVVRTANVVPVYSPPGGNGFDAAAELGCTQVGINMQISNTEGNTIPYTNGYRTAGLMRDPLFANVKLTVANATGAFLPQETVLTYDGIYLVDDGSVLTGNTGIASPSANFPTQVSVGDNLVLDGGTSKQLVSVASIVNATYITVNTASQFSCAAVGVMTITIDPSSATLTSQSNSSTIFVDGLNGTWGQGTPIIGQSSGATGVVSSVSRNGVIKNFNTFVQCWKFSGSYVSGAFQENEFVYQGDTYSNPVATARLYSAVPEGGAITVLASNQVGSFDSSLPIKGANSGAIFNINTKYSPEVRFESGRVCFVRNVDRVERNPAQTEYFNLLLDF